MGWNMKTVRSSQSKNLPHEFATMATEKIEKKDCSVVAPESPDIDVYLNIPPSEALPQTDPRNTPATRREVWSYYAYYAANNGIGSFQ